MAISFFLLSLCVLLVQCVDQIYTSSDGAIELDIHWESGNIYLKKGDFLSFESKDKWPKASPMKIDIEISLADVDQGKFVTASWDRQIVCPNCKSIGGRMDRIHECPICRGNGYIEEKQKSYRKDEKNEHDFLEPTFQEYMKFVCKHCHGVGKIPDENHICPTCQGKRFVKKKHFIEVHIPKGIPDKYEIVYENQASEGWFTSPGDVSFVISVQKHPNFTRNGADLIHHATISIKEAIDGFSYIIHHFMNYPISINRHGEMTPPGTELEIPNQGLPYFENPNVKGSLWVVFNVEFDPQKDMWEGAQEEPFLFREAWKKK